MYKLPLAIDEFTVSKDLKSVTVNNREFAEVLKRERNTSITTSAGPIDFKNISIGFTGEVVIDHPEFAKLVDDALEQKKRSSLGTIDPLAADINVGPACGTEVNFFCPKK